jgi:hypothetical protein
LLPLDRNFFPFAENFDWHLKNIYRNWSQTN